MVVSAPAARTCDDLNGCSVAGLPARQVLGDQRLALEQVLDGNGDLIYVSTLVTDAQLIRSVGFTEGSTDPEPHRAIWQSLHLEQR